ncbi:HPr family phosphocarrier protein [Caproiciproducens sp. R1]|jgi:Phosphotransferase System HPr (HPr) Family|uniref:HPr family phosphocarrier protein n=1 Tax=Caproiciproducens sp. R1 TaxID=3435000 RepID=UPI0040338CF6
MKQFSYTVKDKNGIHARPAGTLVKFCKEFQSEIQISGKQGTASLKKLFSLLGLNIQFGDEVTVTVEGPDEDDAVQRIRKLMSENF